MENVIQDRCKGLDTGTQAHVAQSVEHILGKDEVTSSILVVGSIFARTDRI